jgi:hypothetical protein
MHFCQAPQCKHEDCNKCPLYTKQEDELDAVAMREAGLQAASKVVGATKINVEEMMKLPTAALKK